MLRFGKIQLAPRPMVNPMKSETGVIHWKLIGSSMGDSKPKWGLMRRMIGPENAIMIADVILQKVPISTPVRLAKGTYNAKKKSKAIGTVKRLTVLLVIAMKFPGTTPTMKLSNATSIPVAIAIRRAKATDCLPPFDLFGKKSFINTAVIELIPESILDIAAAKRPETTKPVTTGGRLLAMKCGKSLSAWLLIEPFIGRRFWFTS